MNRTEQMTFHGHDSQLGPTLVSIKDLTAEDGVVVTHMMVRLSVGTFQQFLPAEEDLDPESILAYAKCLCPNLTLDCLVPIISRRASNAMEEFDQKTTLNAKKYKFGVLCQKEGQFNEEEIFKNQSSSQRFEEFLEFLGERKELRGYAGYSGGLDTVHNQTGKEAVFATYQDCEIVFHVARLLPYCESDKQQLARKRHIGNDIVAIVFQEEPTPFSPDIISSQFLHAFIVVQPTKEREYKISVVTKSDVANFGPTLMYQGLYQQSPALREQLLAKLISAEQACYKSNKFLSLEQRTRYSMLSEVSDKLLVETNKYLKPGESRGNSVDENALSSKDKGVLSNMRSILTKRTRSKSLLPTQSSVFPKISKKHPTISKGSSFTPPNTPSLADSSYNDAFFKRTSHNSYSVEKVDKSLIAKVSPNRELTGYIKELHKEITDLEVDKLLLLQNKVEKGKEIEMLRKKQEQLERSLELARKELKLLRIGKPVKYINI